MAEFGSVTAFSHNRQYPGTCSSSGTGFVDLVLVISKTSQSQNAPTRIKGDGMHSFYLFHTVIALRVWIDKSGGCVDLDRTVSVGVGLSGQHCTRPLHAVQSV